MKLIRLFHPDIGPLVLLFVAKGTHTCQENVVHLHTLAKHTFVSRRLAVTTILPFVKKNIRDRGALATAIGMAFATLMQQMWYSPHWRVRHLVQPSRLLVDDVLKAADKSITETHVTGMKHPPDLPLDVPISLARTIPIILFRNFPPSSQISGPLRELPFSIIVAPCFYFVNWLTVVLKSFPRH